MNKINISGQHPGFTDAEIFRGKARKRMIELCAILTDRLSQDLLFTEAEISKIEHSIELLSRECPT